MTEHARRVVLLARPGAACDRMRAALAEANAQLVLEADPTRLEQSALVAASPEVVLVVLDPVTEDVIDRFEGVLGDTSIEVIFEEADLAISREGWDAARWMRHLAAKLHRHGDVLPPGREPDGDGESPPDPLLQRYAGLELVTDRAAPAPAPIEPPALPAWNAGAAEAAVLDETVFAEPARAVEPPPLPAWNADAVGAVALDNADFAEPARPIEPPPLPEWHIDAVAAAPRPDPVPVVDGDVAEAPHQEWSFDARVVPPRAATPPPLTLVLDDDASGIASIGVPAPELDDPAASDRFKRDLADLESRIASLGLVEHHELPNAPSGVVVVFAGIGGPDAVRQLLGALPSTFARPVLVLQRLDGGRYDKLVAQMQRATALPVTLAESGQAISASTVYIVPPTLGIDASKGLAFDDNAAGLLASLPAADSAVLLLSGSDPALVDAAMNLSWAGALVAAQALDGCYDAAAPTELIARGGTAGQPAELAQRLAERWAS